MNFMEEEWTQPERFVARRPSPSSPGWEVLVKWKGQVGAHLVSVCVRVWVFLPACLCACAWVCVCSNLLQHPVGMGGAVLLWGVAAVAPLHCVHS